MRKPWWRSASITSAIRLVKPECLLRSLCLSVCMLVTTPEPLTAFLWNLVFYKKFSTHSNFYWSQTTLTVTTHEDLHEFLHAVKEWGIHIVLFTSQGIIRESPSWCHHLVRRTPLVPYTKVRFWKLSQNCYAMRLFPKLFSYVDPHR
jgi:hypothetical protein